MAAKRGRVNEGCNFSEDPYSLVFSVQFPALADSPRSLLWRVTYAWRRRRMALKEPCMTLGQFVPLRAPPWLTREELPLTRVHLVRPAGTYPRMTFQVVRTFEVKVSLARHLHPRDLLVTSFTVTDDVDRTLVRVFPLVKAVDKDLLAPVDDYISTRLSPLRQVCGGCGHLKTGQHA